MRCRTAGPEPVSISLKARSPSLGNETDLHRPDRSGRVSAAASARRDRRRSDVAEAKLTVTEREAEVLLWIARGKSNRDIAEILDLSPRTVNNTSSRFTPSSESRTAPPPRRLQSARSAFADAAGLCAISVDRKSAGASRGCRCEFKLMVTDLSYGLCRGDAGFWRAWLRSGRGV